MSFDFDSLYQTFLSDTDLFDNYGYERTVNGFVLYCHDMYYESLEPDSGTVTDPAWAWVLDNAPES